MTDRPAPDEVRQLLVHPAVWPYLELWLMAHGITVSPQQISDDGPPTYVMSTPHPAAGVDSRETQR